MLSVWVAWATNSQQLVSWQKNRQMNQALKCQDHVWSQSCTAQDVFSFDILSHQAKLAKLRRSPYFLYDHTNTVCWKKIYRNTILECKALPCRIIPDISWTFLPMRRSCHVTKLTTSSICLNTHLYSAHVQTLVFVLLCLQTQQAWWKSEAKTWCQFKSLTRTDSGNDQMI